MKKGTISGIVGRAAIIIAVTVIYLFRKRKTAE